jgi:hypothetical protein
MRPEKISVVAGWVMIFKEHFLTNEVYEKLLSMIDPAAKDRLIKDPSYESGGRVLLDLIRKTRQP